MVWIAGIGIAALLFAAFPRQMAIILGVAAALVVGVVIYIDADQSARERERSLIKISAGLDSQECSDPTYPVQIIFSNRHPKKTLQYVSFTLEAFRPGFSNAVLRSLFYSSDRIIPPSGVYRSCWKAPEPGFGRDRNLDLASLNWNATADSVRWAD